MQRAATTHAKAAPTKERLPKVIQRKVAARIKEHLPKEARCKVAISVRAAIKTKVAIKTRAAIKTKAAIKTRVAIKISVATDRKAAPNKDAQPKGTPSRNRNGGWIGPHLGRVHPPGARLSCVFRPVFGRDTSGATPISAPILQL